jgi:hypothetical protein
MKKNITIFKNFYVWSVHGQNRAIITKESPQNENKYLEDVAMEETSLVEEAESQVETTDRNVMNCDSCNSNSQRLNKLQDSSRKMKQRNAVLTMKVRMVRRANKEMQKVKLIFILIGIGVNKQYSEHCIEKYPNTV